MRRALSAACLLVAAGSIGLLAASAADALAWLPAVGRLHDTPLAGRAHRSNATAATAPASVLAPPPGSVYTGVSVGSAQAFQDEVGKHPAVYGEFVTWGQSIHFAFNDAAADHARLMLHISTAEGYGARAVITPAGIAAGDGDAYLLSLSALIAAHHRPVYIRLMPEMNNANNAYSGYNADGSSRGPQFAPTAFIAAWRRVVVVLRGGPVSAIDARLEALGQAALRGIAARASVARSPISFVWTPETAGTPDIPQQSAAAYYPGNAYVDWVGTDFYSRFPNFPGLDAFYREFPAKPFAFGEWALWGEDDPTFVQQLFAWVEAHRRVQMMVYNQGYADGPFRLTADPLSAAAIRTLIAPARFLATTPDW
jgi:hypothetical protein